LILRLKEYSSIVSTSNFAKVEEHQSEKLEAEVSNHGHPYMIDFAIDVGIIYSIVLEVDHLELHSTVNSLE
jgi:hypothetical protein